MSFAIRLFDVAKDEHVVSAALIEEGEDDGAEGGPETTADAPA